MLRRPLTALTLTSEDVKAYEDRRQAAAFRSFVSDRGSSSQRAPVSDHTSDYEDYDSDEDEGLEDQEASYYPARYQNQQQSVSDPSQIPLKPPLEKPPSLNPEVKRRPKREPRES